MFNVERLCGGMKRELKEILGVTTVVFEGCIFRVWMYVNDLLFLYNLFIEVFLPVNLN